MNRDNSSKLDEVDLRLLEELQKNARASFRELGAAVHLSSTAAAERVKRLEEGGIIQGYQARLSHEKLGRPISVYIRLRTSADRYPRVLAELEAMNEVLECHHVTGDDSFLIKASVRCMEDLETMIAGISPYGETSTALVMSTPLERPMVLNRA